MTACHLVGDTSTNATALYTLQLPVSDFRRRCIIKCNVTYNNGYNIVQSSPPHFNQSDTEQPNRNAKFTMNGSALRFLKYRFVRRRGLSCSPLALTVNLRWSNINARPRCRCRCSHNRSLAQTKIHVRIQPVIIRLQFFGTYRTTESLHGCPFRWKRYWLER